MPLRFCRTATAGATAVGDVRVKAVMPPGSCVFFVGTLWHGGGANVSDQARLAVTAQYCEPWLRRQETFTLSTSHDTARVVFEEHPPDARLQHPSALPVDGRGRAPQAPARHLILNTRQPTVTFGSVQAPGRLWVRRGSSGLSVRVGRSCDA